MIEVRCCCDGHLIGWMQGSFLEGRDYTFVVAAPPRIVDGGITVSFERLTFRCLTWGDGASHVVALQSRDYPLEQLRRIRGFTEATDGLAPDRRMDDATTLGSGGRCPSVED